MPCPIPMLGVASTRFRVCGDLGFIYADEIRGTPLDISWNRAASTVA